MKAPRPTSHAEKETYYNARTKYAGWLVMLGAIVFGAVFMVVLG